MLIDGLVWNEGFHRAYHMNKTQWITVELNDKVSAEEVQNLLDLSHSLTEKKKSSKKVGNK